MTDRLEKLKDKIFNGFSVWDMSEDDWMYLYEQAERVEELEKDKDEWKDTAQTYYITNQKLREQNRRYRITVEDIRDVMEYLHIDMTGERDTLKGIDNILREHYQSEHDSHD